MRGGQEREPGPPPGVTDNHGAPGMGHHCGHNGVSGQAAGSGPSGARPGCRPDGHSRDRRGTGPRPGPGQHGPAQARVQEEAGPPQVRTRPGGQSGCRAALPGPGGHRPPSARGAHAAPVLLFLLQLVPAAIGGPQRPGP